MLASWYNINPTVKFDIDVKGEIITVDDGLSDIVGTSILQNDTTTFGNSLQKKQTDEQLNVDPNLVQQKRDLNDEFTTYGKPSDTVYDANSTITSTKLLHFLPLGTIRWKKNLTTSWSKISKRKMIKSVRDMTIRYA